MKKTVLFFTLMLLAIAVFGEIVTIYPSDDMYTDPDTGATPVQSELWSANYPSTGHYERIMIKFDLSAYSQRLLQGAELKLTRHFSCPSSGTTAVNFFPLAQEWSENSWDYTQHAPYNSQVQMPFVFSGDGGSVVSDFIIDFTDFTNNWFISGLDNFGFVIIAQDNQKFSKFYSKEFSDQNYWPTLTLNLVDTQQDSQDLPDALCARNYPNPFNPSTTISYLLPSNSIVDIDIYNAKGQLINSLLSSYQTAGSHQILWNGCSNNGSSLPSGIYHYQIRTEHKSSFGSMNLLK